VLQALNLQEDEMDGPVNIERMRDRIYIRTAYSPENVERCKNVGGGRWSKKARAWSYPLDMEVCRNARRWFGDRLVIGPHLAEWARVEKARAVELKAALDLDPRVPVDMSRVAASAPTLAAAMSARGYQTVAAKFGAMCGTHGNFDEQGLGKTVETFGALLEAGITGKILVIAPSTALATTWRDEIERWLVPEVPGGVSWANANAVPAKSGGIKTASKTEREGIIRAFEAEAGSRTMDFLLVNPEMLRVREVETEELDAKGQPVVKQVRAFEQLFNISWDAIIADEVHRYLLNTRGNSASQVGVGMTKLRLCEGGMKIALSGTPMKGRRRNMWGILNWMYPDRYSSKWRWTAKYFEKKANAFSDYDYTDDFIDDLAEKQFGQELDRYSIRRTADELHTINPAWAPPPFTYYEAWVDMEPEQARLYKAMETSATVEMSGGTLMANGILAEMTRLKQLAGCGGRVEGATFTPAFPSAKFDWLVSKYLAERGITGKPGTDSGDNKVIIASQFTQFINLWAGALAALGIKVWRITGETPIGERQMIQRDFQETDNVRVILLNTNAGGVSLTLDRADDVVIMDETWVPDDQSQVMFRARRASNVHHRVSVTFVRTRGTIEEQILEDVGVKDWNQYRALDGRRGIEWAKAHWGVTVTDDKV
jgi:SNF2 family DNA or RNA helicase